jgi:hypothetical protein
MPIRDIHFAKTFVGSEISLQPVVRIPTSPVLVKQLLNSCRAELQTRTEEIWSAKERAKVS